MAGDQGDAARLELGARVAALIVRPLGPDEPIAVAVSGGPDSLALLLSAHAAFGAGRVRALTVDHRLRPEASDEAAMVAGVAARLGVVHATLVWDGPKPRANLQAAARAARYGLMGQWCADNGVGWLATAHHRGDVAETLLLRLARGAGLAGLAGPRARRRLRPGVELLRPLLDADPAALAEIAAAAGVAPVDDPANRAARFDRTRARALLARTRWLAPARVAASAAHLADAEAALAWAADRAWEGRAAMREGEILLDAAGLPAELQRRLLLRALAELSPGAVPRGPDIVRMIAALEAGRAATLAGVRARGGPRWRLRKEGRQRG